MCFSLAFFQDLCVDIVIIAALVAVIRLLVPWLTGLIGMPIIAQIINIVLWAVVAIFCIYVIFGLLGCAVGGFHVGPMLHR